MPMTDIDQETLRTWAANMTGIARELIVRVDWDRNESALRGIWVQCKSQMDQISFNVNVSNDGEVR